MLSPLELLEAVKAAKPGSLIEYYNGGMLTIDAGKEKRAIQAAAYTLYEEGLVLLVSKKVREEVYVYYAIRTKDSYIESRSVLKRFSKLERSA